MTPAINLLKKQKISHSVHQYQHDPAAESYGLEAAELLGIDPGRVFKTLLVSLNSSDKTLAVGIVPVTQQLDLKQMAKAAGAKKAEMANTVVAERSSGYLVGGISPLGQKKRLPTVIHRSAMDHNSIYVSAGRRGLEVELAVADLAHLLRASFAGIAR